MAVQKQPDQASAAETWATVLDLDVEQAKTDPHEVNQKLFLIRHELDHFEQLMKGSQFSQQLYVPYIRKIRSTVTPENISASWKNYKQHLDGEVILALRYCSEIIDDDPPVEFEELEKLLSQLKEFRESLDASHINGTTYDFLHSQISIIEQAIYDYPISGGEAIKKAFYDGFADLNTRAEDLVASEETELTGKIGKFWNNLKEVGKGFVEADRIASAYIGIINKGQCLAESAISLLSGPSS
jgi:hypothetical protein